MALKITLDMVLTPSEDYEFQPTVVAFAQALKALVDNTEQNMQSLMEQVAGHLNIMEEGSDNSLNQFNEQTANLSAILADKFVRAAYVLKTPADKDKAGYAPLADMSDSVDALSIDIEQRVEDFIQSTNAMVTEKTNLIREGAKLVADQMLTTLVQGNPRAFLKAPPGDAEIIIITPGEDEDIPEAQTTES